MFHSKPVYLIIFHAKGPKSFLKSMSEVNFPPDPASPFHYACFSNLIESIGVVKF